jgi:hypothetical protein
MSQIGARLVFDNARSLVQSAGFNVNQAVLSQSYLRSEVLMSTTNTNYHIPILVNDTQNGNITYQTENRLALQDAFVVSAIGIFVAAPATATATNFPYYTYPNAQVFSTSGAAAALYNLYNGSFQVVINNRQITPSWSVYRHLYVPQTQQGSQSGSNAGIDQNDASSNGYFPCEPNLVFVGSKNNVVSIGLPNSIGTLQAGTAPKIVVQFLGILAQNVTPVR